MLSYGRAANKSQIFFGSAVFNLKIKVFSGRMTVVRYLATSITNNSKQLVMSVRSSFGITSVTHGSGRLNWSSEFTAATCNQI